MSLQQLFILAGASMVVLAVSRVIRAHAGRAPHPDGSARLLFVLAFLFLPPIALGALNPPSSGQLRGLAWVPLYAVLLVALAILVSLLALVARGVAPGRSRRFLLLALNGSEGDPNDVPFDPPVSASLAASVSVVERTNLEFPRGPEFPAQVDRPGFRADWDALDDATAALEGPIADDHRLGLAVASTVNATAIDARSRLDTLRRLAVDHRQVWAAA
jgi:hypothetical protein